MNGVASRPVATRDCRAIGVERRVREEINANTNRKSNALEKASSSRRIGRLKQKAPERNGCQSEHGEPVILKLRLRRAVKVRNRFDCFARVRFDFRRRRDTVHSEHIQSFYFY